MFDNVKNKYVPPQSKVYIKYLGVLNNQNLSWKYHIDSIVTKLGKNVGLLRKLRHSVPRPLRLNIHVQVTNSSLFNLWSYCLGSGVQDLSEKILILQKKTVFVCCTSQTGTTMQLLYISKLTCFQ